MASDTPQAAAKPVIIIGTGQAGTSVAREFRKLDSETPVLMLSSDDGAGYYKPNLSKAYASGKDAEGLITADAEKLAGQLGVEIRPNAMAAFVNPAAKTLRVSIETIEYSQLVLATGAHCRLLPFKGDAVQRMCSVNNRLDYARFRQAVAGSKHITIIGAGLIGCEFANDLTNAGYQVAVIDLLSWPLGRLLPEQAGQALQRGLADVGVEWHLQQSIESLVVDGEQTKVTLESGTQWNTDVVLSAVGLQPAVELAAAAGLDTNRGVVVNRQLETSAEGIYALGDCAELEGGLVLPYIAPILHCAKTIAKRLVGEEAALSLPAMPVIVKTPACPTIISPPAVGAEGRWKVSGEGQNLECRFEGSNGELLGCALLGDVSKQRMAYQRELPAVL